MGHFKGCVTHFPCLLTEDGAQQPLFSSQLRLSLRGHLTHQDIPCADLGPDADDSALVQVLKGIFTNAGNIPGDFFRSQLGVTGFCLVFLNVDRCIYIFLNKAFRKKDSILVVVTFPGHESD